MKHAIIILWLVMTAMLASVIGENLQQARELEACAAAHTNAKEAIAP